MTFQLARPRIGAVEYLNSEPLVFRLSEIAAPCDLEFDVPRRLAERLTTRSLDLALIPTASFFRHSDLAIVSDACIACHGPVWSVKLLSRVKCQDIRTLAVDEGSATSVVLARKSCCQGDTVSAPPWSRFRSAQPSKKRQPTQSLSSATGPCTRLATTSKLPGTWGKPGVNGRAYRSCLRYGRGASVWIGPGWNAHSNRPVIWVWQTYLKSPPREAPDAACQSRPVRNTSPAICTSDWESANGKVCWSSIAKPSAWDWYRPIRSKEYNMIARLLDSTLDGQRLTREEALALLQSHDLTALGQAADAVTRRWHPQAIRTYNIDRNINYTNVCTAVCDFARSIASRKVPKDMYCLVNIYCRKSMKPCRWAATRF